MKKILLIIITFFSSFITVQAQQAGSLDGSFYGYGRYVSSKNSKGGSFSKILSDGKILIVFMSNYVDGSGISMAELYSQRLNPNGTPDITFGTNGTGIIYQGGVGHSGGIYQTLKNVVIQPDGKYIIGRQDGNGLIYFNRLNVDGTFDNTFSSNSFGPQPGYNFISMGQANIQPNGKVVVGVSHYKNGEVLTTILRLNSDGTKDLGFDGDGYAVLPNSSIDLETTDIAFQPDGKILVLLSQCGGFCRIAFLLRLNTNGSLDTSFGTNGSQYLTSIGYTWETIYTSSICLKPDGKIVIGGGSSAGNGIRATLIGLQANGAFDNSFGTNGYLISSSSFYVESLKLQPDGKMVGAGSKSVFRFNADGSLDTAFDLDGYNNYLLDYEKETIIQNDGKLLLMGITSDLTYFTLTRIHGVSNFNSNNGKMITQIGISNEQANAIALRPNGKIITGGYAFNAVNGSSNNDFALVGYNADGSLDYTFGNNALVKTDINTNSVDEIKAIAIQSDGKIIAAGTVGSGAATNIVVARYLADGSGLDATFGVNGRIIVDFTGTQDIPYAVALQADGKILVAGRTAVGANIDVSVLRLTSTGGLDGTFDGDGRLNFNMGAGYDSSLGRGVAIQTDGKIVIGIYASGDFGVARLNTNGSFDTSFDGDGKVTASFGASTFEEVSGVFVQADGKIVVGGNTDLVGSYDDFAVMRFNANGSLDNTFGSGGKTLIGFNINTGDLSTAMTVYPNGKIVLAGQAGYGTIGVARFNSNGTIDNDFDGDGRITLEIGYGIDQVKAMALQTDGKIILAGNYANGANDDFALISLPACITNVITLTNPSGNYPNATLPNPQIGKSITATNLVNSPANVTYRTSSSITLNPGFKVDNGAIFKTEIVGCSY